MAGSRRLAALKGWCTRKGHIDKFYSWRKAYSQRFKVTKCQRCGRIFEHVDIGRLVTDYTRDIAAKFKDAVTSANPLYDAMCRDFPKPIEGGKTLNGR